MKISYTNVLENMVRMHNLTMQLKEILDDVSMEIKKLEEDEIWSDLGAEDTYNNYDKLKSNFIPIYEELERCILFIADVSEEYKNLDRKVKNEVLKNLDLSKPDYTASRIFISQSTSKN